MTTDQQLMSPGFTPVQLAPNAVSSRPAEASKVELKTERDASNEPCRDTPQNGLEYKTLIPGTLHFTCRQLRATLSTGDCGSRWLQAERGSSCKGCEHGQQHAQMHQPAQACSAKLRQSQSSACVRCGRTHLRIIQCQGLCISCFNRSAEVHKGKNGKGTTPVKLKLQDVEATFRLADGSLERRRYSVSVSCPHEARRRAMRDLPAGAELVSIDPLESLGTTS